jgi:hypothetical protein
MSGLGATDCTAVERRVLSDMAHLWLPGSVYELRILGGGRGVVSGYFDDAEAFAKAATSWSGKANVFWTINPVRPDLLGRAANRLREFTRGNETTSDADIVRRRWLPIDIDPIRPAGVAATHREHCLALAMVGRIADFMASKGFPEPVEMDSGNGGYLLYPESLPNNEEARPVVKRCLQALSSKFDSATARVDTSTYNASRIMRVPGTLNCKGDPTLERPHRLAILTSYPKVQL